MSAPPPVRELPHGGGPLEARLAAELPALRRWLRRLAGPAEADDLAQEVALRALRYARSFDRSRPLGPWLRAAALRVHLDHRARALRAPLALADEPSEPARTEERAGQREELERLLAPLSAVERAVLLRFHGREQPVRAIAADLALPEGTVKSHLFRARRRLLAWAGGIALALAALLLARLDAPAPGPAPAPLSAASAPSRSRVVSFRAVSAVATPTSLRTLELDGAALRERAWLRHDPTATLAVAQSTRTLR